MASRRPSRSPATDTEDNERRIFASTKCNLAVEPGALTYSLVSQDSGQSAHIKWEGTSSYTAADLSDSAKSSSEGSARVRVAAFIRSQLDNRGGNAPAKEIIVAGEPAGFTENVLKKARKSSGAQTRKFGRDSWEWFLPDG